MTSQRVIVTATRRWCILSSIARKTAGSLKLGPYHCRSFTNLSSIQILKFHSGTRSCFYESLEEALREKSLENSKTFSPDKFLSVFTSKQLEYFESDPERYHFVKIHLDLSKHLLDVQNDQFRNEDTRNLEILKSIKKEVSKVSYSDEEKNNLSVQELDYRQDVLFNGLQKLLLITNLEDQKLNIFILNIQAAYHDLSCSIFDQFWGKEYLEEPHFKHLCFSLAYLWIKVNEHMKKNTQRIDFSIQNWNGRSNYLLKFVSYYIARQDTETLNNLKPQEFLLCMFIIGLHRKLPGINYYSKDFDSTKMAFSIPEKIENVALLHFSEFSISEIGLLANGLYMANLNPAKPLHHKMFESLLKLDKNEVSKEDYSISYILKVLSKCDNNPVMGLRLMNKYIPLLNELSIHGKVRLGVFIQARRSEDSAAFVEPFIDSLKEDIKFCRLKDLAKIAWILTDLKCSEANNEEFCEAMMRHAIKCIQGKQDIPTHINNGQDFILFVYHMSNLSYISGLVLHDLITVTNESNILKMAQNDNELLMKGAPDVFNRILRFSRSENVLVKRNNSTSQKQIRSLRYQLRSAAALKQIAILDSRIDHLLPDYKGNRLNLDIKEKLVKINVGKTKLNSMINAFNKYEPQPCSV